MARPFLLLSHPGHELRLFHWMEQASPMVACLTDGSGGSAVARTDYSDQCVRSAGAVYYPLAGTRSDRAWYQAILRRDSAPFLDAVAAVVACRPNLVVSDAVDGYNPMHDLCAAVGAAAAARLGVAHLVSRAITGGTEEIAHKIGLDPDAIGRKLAAVAAYGPVAEEVRRILKVEESALSVECLRRPVFMWPEHHTPDWEETGRARVGDRRYGEAIEYARHVRPIAWAVLHAPSE